MKVTSEEKWLTTLCSDHIPVEQTLLLSFSMAGRGRGRGRGMSINIEALGLGREEILPAVAQPPPLYPVSLCLINNSYFYLLNGCLIVNSYLYLSNSYFYLFSSNSVIWINEGVGECMNWFHYVCSRKSASNRNMKAEVQSVLSFFFVSHTCRYFKIIDNTISINHNTFK